MIRVAEMMYELGLEVSNGDEKYAEDMYVLGLLHDVGRAFSDEDKVLHEYKGASMLERVGYKYWREIMNHGNPDSIYESVELGILKHADLTVNKEGDDVGVIDRMMDVADRYGLDSIQFEMTRKMVENKFKNGYFE